MTQSDIDYMITFCKCFKCKDFKKCNNVDLMNCYAKKKITIKEVGLSNGEKNNENDKI